jgi:predicted dienelactone hydrolase
MRRALLILVAAVATAVLTVGAAVPAFAQGADVGHRVENLEVANSVTCPTNPCPRKVKVHLWYPADRKEFSQAPKTEYTSALHGAALPTPWHSLSWKVEAEIARETGAIDPQGQPFPVIVFSHGAVNDPIDYAHTLELIAAEGFVVAAPYHANNTQDDVRIDFMNARGATFPCSDGLAGPCARASVPNSMQDRVNDISHILGALPGWFGDRVDATRAGVLGHSRGTVTALAAAGGSTAWGFGPLRTPGGQPMVKAVMGMAIGAPAITFAANLATVTVPAVLVAGGRDRNSVQQVSEDAFEAVSSDDKLFVGIPNATHRSFDSTYCGQLQSAGAAFDLDHDGVVELSDLDTDGDRVVERSELDSSRAILDLHTVRLIAASPPGGNSGKAVHYCAAEFFTSPVDIRELVGALAGEAPGSEFSCLDEEVRRVCAPVRGPSSVCLTDTVPCTGLDTDEVKDGVKEIAAAFFDSALKRTGNDGIHFTRYLAPNWLMEHVPMVGSARAYAGPGSVCPPDQGVICSD